MADENGVALEGLPDPPDRAELLRLLGVRAREGHVTALRILPMELRRDEGLRPAGDPFDDFDELADRRRKDADRVKGS